MSNEVYSEEDLRDFLKEFLDEYRKKLDDGYVPKSRLTDFNSPCQIHVIWFTPYDIQNIFVTHLDTLPDKEIIIIRTHYSEALDKMQEWVNQKYWPEGPDIEFKGEIQPYRVEPILPEIEDVELLMNIRLASLYYEQTERIFALICENREERDEVFSHPLGHTRDGEWYISNVQFSHWPTGFQWIGNGLFQLDMDDWISNTLVIPEKLDIQLEKILQHPKLWKRGLDTTRFYSVFSYPAIWVGEYPFKTIKDILQGIYPDHAGQEIVIKTEFRDRSLWVSKLGCFYINCSNIKEALRLLNALMGYLALTKSIETRAVRKNDLGYANIDSSTETIVEDYHQESSRRVWILQEESLDVEDFSDWKNKIRTINPVELEEGIKIANMFSEEYDNAVGLILEAMSLYRENAFNASFLLSWTLLESLFSDAWGNYLDNEFSERINSDNRANMKESPNWPISVKIRSFQLANQIDDNLTRLIDKFRKLRNNLVHNPLDEEIEVTGYQSQAILNMCIDILAKAVSKEPWSNISINDDELTKILNNWNKQEPDAY
ncbi:MAG: hypothetical protein ACTSP4_08080 [Candidatus Hodarchaeales archaeon]